MKSKKIRQSLVNVKFVKEFAGHAIGNVIATDVMTVNFLIGKGVVEKCENKAEIKKPEIKKVIVNAQKPAKKVDKKAPKKVTKK